jgi:hypothetical protein
VFLDDLIDILNGNKNSIMINILFYALLSFPSLHNNSDAGIYFPKYLKIKKRHGACVEAGKAFCSPSQTSQEYQDLFQAEGFQSDYK